jgi:hypothetical protein
MRVLSSCQATRRRMAWHTVDHLWEIEARIV